MQDERPGTAQTAACSSSEDISVVDIFCGVGGLSHGFRKAGFSIAAGIDADKTCSYAFEINNDAEFVAAKIEDVRSNEVESYFAGSSATVLAGCAPCRPYSSNAPKKNKDEWKLLGEFSRIVTDVLPDVVTMENVIPLRSYQKGAVLTTFVDHLGDLDYVVSVQNVYCPDYGVPQARRRMVLLASRRGSITLGAPTHAPSDYVTVRDAIGALSPIQAGRSSDDDPIHVSSALSELNLQRMRASVPGGTWENWDESLRAPCHLKPSGSSYKGYYGRMEWDSPSPTITTQFNGYGSGRFGHPDQDRAISLREGAILQTFPPEYIFAELDEPVVITPLARHIGNAVPVRLGEIVARSIARHLKDSSHSDA